MKPRKEHREGAKEERTKRNRLPHQNVPAADNTLDQERKNRKTVETELPSEKNRRTQPTKRGRKGLRLSRSSPNEPPRKKPTSEPTVNIIEKRSEGRSSLFEFRKEENENRKPTEQQEEKISK